MAKLAITPVGLDTSDWRAVVMAANLIWRSHNQKPTAITIKQVCTSLSLETIRSILETEEFTAAMIQAGIPWLDGVDSLSSRQMMALQVMANPLTGRNTAQRLKMAGVTAREWETWKRNPIFRETWERLCYELLESHEGELKAELLKQALDGKLEALKYIHELTGAHTPAATRISDMQTFVQTILEIIQTEVTDTATLNRISTRVMAALSPNTHPPSTSSILRELVAHGDVND